MEQMLEGEMDSHLGYTKHSAEGINSGNSRNGKGSKKVKTKLGEVELAIPRDRNSTFEPCLDTQAEPHGRRNWRSGNLLYARGKASGVRDIELQIRDIYGYTISESTVSNITAKVQSHISEWQSLPLASVYFVVWMDGMVFKVRQNGKVVNKTIYLAVGLNSEGHKDVLGMWLGESESASFWMSVLTDMRSRGVDDILITSTDNLKGFTEAITSVFLIIDHPDLCGASNPECFSLCGMERQKTVCCRSEKVYTAANKDLAWAALEELENIWGKKHPHAIRSWKANWQDLTHFFDFPLEIRTLIYTTNIIENLNGKVKKVHQNKMSFPDDQSVMKAAISGTERMHASGRPIRNWSLVVNQFINIFEERCKI